VLVFTDVVSDLKKGLLPKDLSAFKKRFEIAMIKKMGVLRLPYHFWSNDPKINPSSEQLVWATLILEDPGFFVQVEEVVALEVSEQLQGKSTANELLSAIRERLNEHMDTFVGFAPNESFRHLLAGKISRSPWSRKTGS